jgi:hypothetical protein
VCAARVRRSEICPFELVDHESLGGEVLERFAVEVVGREAHGGGSSRRWSARIAARLLRTCASTTTRPPGPARA